MRPGRAWRTARSSHLPICADYGLHGSWQSRSACSMRCGADERNRSTRGVWAVPAGRAKSRSRIKEASGLTISRRTSGVRGRITIQVSRCCMRSIPVEHHVRPRSRSQRNSRGLGRCDPPLAVRPAIASLSDIDDNDRRRSAITVYRIPEPQPADAQSAAPEVFSAHLPRRRPRRRSALRRRRKPVRDHERRSGILYRISQSHPGTVKAERIGELGIPRITDADVSADGKLVVVRTNNEVAFYPTAALVAGKSTNPTFRFRCGRLKSRGVRVWRSTAIPRSYLHDEEVAAAAIERADMRPAGGRQPAAAAVAVTRLP